ncbi:thiamine-phosphate kinase [Desulfurobacterium sp. TC5-1]|uniref:thiamine-phosphate kinase n=1 Tax=Desulfurobacterium sp. TC5-1 TaxID=1158318 RepID=UPI0003B7B2CC|nr:thiamine-phosphate kinase [Desulfurobacterium sp. TC5-1]
MKEFDLIEKISRFFKSPAKGIGIGDDTAAIRSGYEYHLITVDTLTEGTHYRKEWRKVFPHLYRSIGWKLLAVSVSDIASMGGMPHAAVTSFTLKKDFEEGEIVELAKGLSAACNHFNVLLVGGDTVKGNCEAFSLTLTGEAEEIMTRSAAKPGDLVAVTGICGDAAAGLNIIESGKIDTIEKRKLVERFLFPRPSIEMGKRLVLSGVKCCMDNSDGLLLTCHEIASKSNVAVNLESKKIPVSKEVKKLFGDKAFKFALSGGEDFNLVFTFPESLKSLFKKEKNVFIIGRVTEGSGTYIDGKPAQISSFDHFGG